MNVINAKEGTKIKYIGCTDAQVHRAGHSDPRNLLKEGNIYTVLKIEAGNWSSEVFLQEFPDKGFNTVCFEEVQDENNS